MFTGFAGPARAALGLLISLLLTTTSYAAGGDLQWAYGVAAGGKQEARAAAFDSQGAAIVCGFTGSASTDFFTAKVKADGTALAWPVATFDLAGGNDAATAVAVDSLNNVYVGGYSQNGLGKDDFLLLKYAPSGPNPDGSPMWSETYEGAAAGHDRIVAIAAGADAVAVTGESQNAAGDFDALTLKYRADGSLHWTAERRYATAAGGDSRGTAVAVDADGSVVMTGSVFNGSDSDLYTVKYPSADGPAQWVRQIDNGYDDEARALWIDGFGDVYVTGTTFGLSSNTDVLTAKYDGVDGTEAWRAQYNSTNGDNDVGVDVTVDESGDVVVVGYDDNAVDGFDDFLTLKYRKDDGTLLWERSRDVAQHDDRAVAVGLAPDESVLVAGWSDRWTDGASDYDYHVFSYDPGALDPPTGLAATVVSNTEIALSWQDNAAGEDGFTVERKVCATGTYASVSTGLAPDAVSYTDTGLQTDTRYCYRVKATSASLGDSPYSNEVDARTTVVSYDTPTWLYRLNGPDDGDDYPEAVAIGPDGNPVVTGHSFSLSSAFDYLTVKLDRIDAAQLWQARYDDPDFESDFATSLAVDSGNRVVVTGFASLYGGGAGNTNDVYTLAYAADGATVLWDDQYNGPDGGDDRSSAVATATDGSDNIVVIGYGRNAAWNDDIYVIHYLADGTRDWAATPYDGGGNDYPATVAFDAAGDVFVGGHTFNGSDRDFFVAKYRGSDGAMIWMDAFAGAGGDDMVEDLAVDAAGDLYVCGYSVNAAGNGDFYTVKYDGAGDGVADADGIFGGRILWQHAFDGGGYDRAVGVELDPVDGEVVVAGTTFVGSGNHDFHLIRYAPQGDGSGGGAIVWQKSLDRPDSDEAVAAVDIDRAGTVSLVGTTEGGGADMLTVKYDYRGEVVDAAVYAGAAGADDAPADVAVNRFGEAFVAGSSLNAAGNADYVVFRADGGPMQPPVPFSATQQYTEAELQWGDNSLDEAGFRLERKIGACVEAGTWVALADVAPATTGYLDSGLNIDSTYCYRVRSFDASGDASRWIETEVTTAAPLAPSELTGVVRDTTTVELNWTVNTSTESGFTLERCQGSNCDFSVVDATFDLAADSDSFIDTTACAGQTYSYRLNAYQSAAWTSAWSNTASGLAMPLAAAPDGLAVAGVFENRVDLAWTDHADDETAFVIERCPTEAASCLQDADFVQVGTVSQNPSGLLLHYRMDDSAWSGAADEVDDASGRGNHGTAFGGLYTTVEGKVGRSAAFDGSDDYIATTVDIDQSATGPGATMQAWVRPDAASSGYNYVFGTEDGGYDWGLLRNGSYWYVSTGQNLWYTGLAVDTDQWQHVVAVFEPGVGVRFYRNGVERSTTVIDYDSADSILSIGQSGFGVSGTYFFAGDIDEAAVHDRPLSAAEIQAQYNEGVARFADRTVTHGSTYTYRVRADKSGGCGWPTAPTATVEAYTAPTAPDNLVATALETTVVQLQWRSRTDSETAFRVLRCQGIDCTDFVEIGTAAGGVTEYLDDSVCAGNDYRYQVTAVRDAAWETSPSPAAAVSTVVPQAPTAFAATGISEERVALEWVYPEKDRTGFRIGRCLGDATVCIDDVDFASVAEVDGKLSGLGFLYRMEEASWEGTAGEVKDSSGNGNDGTAYSGLTTIAEGRFGRAAEFDPTASQFIVTPVNLDQSATSAGATMEAWVYPTSTASGYRFVFGTDNGGTDWGLAQYGSYWYVTTGNSYQNTGVQVTANQWQHVAAVFIPGTGVKFYKDGSAPVTIADIGYDTSDYNVSIGRRGSSTYLFQGRIDEAAVYGRALSDQEVVDRFVGRVRHVDTGLAPGSTYTYRVWPYKTAICAWDGPHAETSASSLSLTAPADFVGQVRDTTRIDLSWSATTTSETGFRLDHCPGTLVECLGDPGADPPVAPTAVFDDPALILDAGAEQYSDASVCAGSVHTYRVRAEPWPTEWAGPVEVGTPEPSTPANLRLVDASESEITLGWDDSNEDESRYVLERCDGDAASCPVDTGTFTTVQTLTGTLDGRLLHYRMDEAAWTGAADEVLDASGQGRHGQAVNGAVTDPAGRFDGAGSFDGGNDYVATPLNIDQSDATAGATFEAWVYPTVSSTAYRHVFGTENGGYDWGLLHYNNRWYLSTGKSRYSTSVAVDLNQWQHIVVVFDPASGIKVYKNGIEAYTMSTYYLGFDASDANVAIGQNGQNAYFFAGRIDEAAVYDRPLAATDIDRHFRLGVNRFGHTDGGLVPGTAYTYRVRAEKSSACPWATPYAALTAATETPPAPESLTATATDTTTMALSWIDTTTSETGFRIQRCTGAGCSDFVDFEPAVVTAANAQGYSDAGVCSDTTYGYRIRAENDQMPWVTTWAGPASAATAPPQPPSNVQAVRLSEVEVRLSWSSGTSDESGFIIERCADASCSEITVGAGVSQFVDDLLEPLTTYSYRVKAFKTAACGWETDFSAGASVTTEVDGPDVTIAAVNTTEALLSWNDTAVSETGYSVERCSGESCADFAELDPPVLLPPDTTSFTDPTLCFGQSYGYRVQALARPVTLSNDGGGCWTRRRPVNFGSFQANARTYLTVVYDSDMRSDFGDLRFFDVKANRELTYWIREKTDGSQAKVWLETGANSDIYMYYGNPAATDAGNETAFVTVYEDFAGDSFDTGKWTVKNARYALEQDDGLRLKDLAPESWTDTLLVSNEMFYRESQPILTFDVSIAADTPGINAFMSGWYSNTTTYASFNHGRFMVYWNDYNFYWRESFSDGSTGKTYAAATDYEVKVELKESRGARYFVRGGAYADWTLLADSNTIADGLRIAVLQYSHEAVVNDIKLWYAAGSGASAGAEEQAACYVFGRSWDGGFGSPAWATTTVPTDAGSLAVEALSDRQVQLSWSDINPDETGFALERCRVGDTCPAYSQVGVADGGTLLFTDETAQPSTTYSYRIRAFKTATCGWQTAYSNAAADATFPAAVGDLQATALNSRKIRLQWTDQASDEEGYEIEVQAWNGRFVTVETVGFDASEYVDTIGIEPEDEYRYRVRPYRGEDKSPYSNEATVTTPAWQAGDDTCRP